MIPHRVLVVLMSVLAVLLVGFGVVMGFFLLTGAMADQPMASALLWIGRALAVLLVTDLVLVVVVLGLNAIGREP